MPDPEIATHKVTILERITYRFKDVEVPLPSRPLLVLGYLALNPNKAIPRDVIARLFWSSGDARKARHSLSQSLYAIRQKAPDLDIEATSDWIKMRSNIHVDVAELFFAAKTNDIEQLCTLYRGDFFPISAEKLPRAFHEWRDNHESNLRQSVTSVLERGILDRCAQGRWEECLAIANTLRLHQDLAPALNALAQKAQEMVSTLPDTAAGLQRSPQFVGREHEIRWLREAWSMARRGEPRLCIIRGESGVGKSRLLNHMGRIAAVEGARVITAKSYEAEKHVAFAPVLTLLDQLQLEDYLPLLSESQRRSLGALAPTETQLMTDLGAASKYVVLEAISAAIGFACADRPIFIALDDYQWADESSMEWLHHFYRSLQDKAAFVLVCIRGDSASGGPVSTWLQQLPANCVLELDVLLPQDAERLVSQVTEGATDVEKQAIIKRCGGNPFYIIAMARDQRAERNSEFRSHAPDRLPDAIRHSILTRFRQLSQPAQSVAETLAIANKGLELSILLPATGLSFAVVVEAVAELEKVRLIKDRPVDLSHDLIKQAIYSAITPVTKQLRHRQLFAALGSNARPNVRAYHAHFGGLHSEAHREANSAASEAMAIHAYSEAQFYRMLAAENASNNEERWYSLLELTKLWFRLRQYSRIGEYVDELYALCQARNDTAGALLCRIHQIVAKVATQSANSDSLWSELKQLLPDIFKQEDENLIRETVTLGTYLYQHISIQEEIERDVLARVEALEGAVSKATQVSLMEQVAMAMSTKNPSRAVAIVNAAVELAAELHDPCMSIRCLNASGLVNMAMGNIDAALQDFSTAESLLHDDAMRHVLTATYINRACLHFGRGDLIEARAYNQKGITVDTSDTLVPRMNETCALLNIGDYNSVIEWVNRILDENKLFRAPWVELVARSVRGLAELGLGCIETAIRTYSEIEELPHHGRVYTADPSYNLVFQAKIECIKTGNAAGCKILANALESIPYINPFGVCRIELALAELLLPIDPDRSYRYARNCGDHSEQLGSHFMVARAQEHMQKIRDSGF